MNAFDFTLSNENNYMKHCIINLTSLHSSCGLILYSDIKMITFETPAYPRELLTSTLRCYGFYIYTDNTTLNAMPFDMSHMQFLHTYMYMVIDSCASRDLFYKGKQGLKLGPWFIYLL